MPPETMTKFVALLRGFNPINPNMRNDKLREVFISLGFKSVQTVISSGNVIFQSNIRNTKVLENKVEKTLFQKLGFKSTTIIRSENQFKKLVNRDPFCGTNDTPESRLNVTFLKSGGEIFSIIDTTNNTRTFETMSQLEKQHGKEITTRTWQTIGRIMKKLNIGID